MQRRNVALEMLSQELQSQRYRTFQALKRFSSFKEKAESELSTIVSALKATKNRELEKNRSKIKKLKKALSVAKERISLWKSRALTLKGSTRWEEDELSILGDKDDDIAGLLTLSSRASEKQNQRERGEFQSKADEHRAKDNMRTSFDHECEVNRTQDVERGISTKTSLGRHSGQEGQPERHKGKNISGKIDKNKPWNPYSRVGGNISRKLRGHRPRMRSISGMKRAAMVKDVMAKQASLRSSAANHARLTKEKATVQAHNQSAAHVAAVSGDTRKLKRVFNRLDRNGDGIVSKRELILSLKRDKTRALQHFLGLNSGAGSRLEKRSTRYNEVKRQVERLLSLMALDDSRDISWEDFLRFFVDDMKVEGLEFYPIIFLWTSGNLDNPPPHLMGEDTESWILRLSAVPSTSPLGRGTKLSKLNN